MDAIVPAARNLDLLKLKIGRELNQSAANAYRPLEPRLHYERSCSSDSAGSRVLRPVVMTVQRYERSC